MPELNKENAIKIIQEMPEFSVSNLVTKLVQDMTVLDLVNLTKELEETFGVSAMPMMAAPMAGQVVEAAAEAAEEKTEFDLVLATVGEKKIQVIKVVRALTGLGLKEAKDLVEGSPATVKEAVSKKEAEDMKAKLEEVGATVEIK